MLSNTSLKNIIITAGILYLLIQISACNNNELGPPKALRIEHTEAFNDDVRVDNYYWLRDRGNPEVMDYLRAENQYTDIIMRGTKSLQDRLFEEYRKRDFEESSEAAQSIGEYYYYKRIIKGKQYPVFLRKQKSLDAREEIILDQNKLADKFSYCSISSVEISNDQKYLAYSIDTSGAESYTIFIKDLATNTPIKDCITKSSTNFVWSNDNRTLYYCRIDAANKANRVYKHRIGEDSSRDEFVYYEKDDSYNIELYKSYSRNYIFIGIGNNTTTETYFIDANAPDAKPRLIHPRQTDLQYYVYDRGDKFYILTNDNAHNYKVVETSINAPGKNNWKDIIPYKKEIKIDDMVVFRKHLVLFKRINGIAKIEVINLTDKSRHYIKFNETAYSVRFDKSSEFNSSIIRISYSSLTTPNTIYDYNMDTRKIKIVNESRSNTGYTPSLYVTERIFAHAADGKEIPIVIAYKKGMVRNASNPLLLTGYGAYNISNEPKFSTDIVSLLDRGVIYAIAHVRGGGEIDDEWYEDGKLLKKKNTFTDFIACAEHLIKEKYTSKEKLAIWGRSAGGLLVGTVLNMRPDLFKAVVSEMPFVDVLNTMLDPSLFGTIQDYDEWGNPNNKVFYDYIKSYSPYDNIKEQKYPDLLVIGSLNDQRVSYWEPLKWTAKLREKKKDNNLLLLRIYENADHRGASGIYDNYRMLAFKNAFILDRLGIHN